MGRRLHQVGRRSDLHLGHLCVNQERHNELNLTPLDQPRRDHVTRTSHTHSFYLFFACLSASAIMFAMACMCPNAMFWDTVLVSFCTVYFLLQGFVYNCHFYMLASRLKTVF